MSASKQLSIKKALKGKHVFITGSTGFVGKAVVEKLLRAVPDIGGIYLLIRASRKYPSAQGRFLEEVASSSVFGQLKKQDGVDFDRLCEQKIHCITGEMTMPGFGLSYQVYQDLVGKIDIVINSAASVNFREALDQALEINTLCLLNTAKFVEDAGNIPLLQVSTCYVNGYRQGQIDEVVYGPTGNSIGRSAEGFYEVEPVIEELLAECMSIQERIEDPGKREAALVEVGIAQANAYGWNDTYTFTKWMGEQLLMKRLQGQSLTIVRPSIVESAWSDPSPGWIEGVKVADAIILAYAREKVTFFPGNPMAIIDIIPVDLVVNSIVVAAAEQLSEEPGHRIYQCASSVRNPLRISTMKRHVEQAGQTEYRRYPNLFYRQPRKKLLMVPQPLFNSVMGGVKLSLNTLKKVAGWLSVDLQYRSLTNMETTINLATVFSFYTAPKYTFSSDKLMWLAEKVCTAEKELFCLDSAQVDWHRYLSEIHLNGLDKYALRPRKLYGQEKQKVNAEQKVA